MIQKLLWYILDDIKRKALWYYYGTIMVLDDIYRKLLQYENYHGIYLMIYREKHYGTIMVLLWYSMISSENYYNMKTTMVPLWHLMVSSENYYNTKTTMVYT